MKSRKVFKSFLNLDLTQDEEKQLTALDSNAMASVKGGNSFVACNAPFAQTTSFIACNAPFAKTTSFIACNAPFAK